MSSQIARIEIYENDGDWSYGCLELDLMGYSDIFDLMYCIKVLLK